MDEATRDRPGAVRRRLRGVGSAFWAAYRNWRRHRTIRLGAGLAYYGLFAVVPLVSLMLFLAGLVFSQGQIRSFISDHVGDTSGAELGSVAGRVAEDLGSGATLTSLGLPVG